MYQKIVAVDEVKVPPEKFEMDVKDAIKECLIENLEGTLDKNIGVFLAITDVYDVGEGIIKPNDPSVHYNVKFEALVWKPIEHEIIEAEVTDITEFGVFLRIGAIDGFVHISQIMDDYVSFDEKNMQITGKQSKRSLKVGDIVRARIISISFKEQTKINLTMRQPFLGAKKWIETASKAKKEEAKEKKKKVPKKGGEKGK
ncbi:MAG: DNA-directed RNA polymerase [Candidatus Aenigmarchaeota archaeon]|nr:DNA-directed RNA polymerase [Candidatus Aenigmarchaeota archaeon]